MKSCNGCSKQPYVLSLNGFLTAQNFEFWSSHLVTSSGRGERGGGDRVKGGGYEGGGWEGVNSRGRKGGGKGEAE